MRQRSRWHQSSREREAPSHRGPSGPAACDVSFGCRLCPCTLHARRCGCASGRGRVMCMPCGLGGRYTYYAQFFISKSMYEAGRGPRAERRAPCDTARGAEQRAGARTQTRYTHDAPTCAPADRCMHIIHSVSCPHAPYISGSKCGMPLCKHPETEPAAAHPPVEVSCQASYRSTRRPGHLTVSLTETYPGAACRDYTCTAGAPTAPPRSRSYAPRYQ